MTEATASSPSAVSRPSSSRARRDPLALILGPVERWDLISICVAIALALHVAMLLFAIVAGLLKDLHSAVADNRLRLHDFFWRQYDVEVEKPKEQPKPEPPPPEPPPPEPAPAPLKAAPKPVEDDPYKNVAPKPAEATKILAAEPRPDDPVELPTIVSGNGNAVGGQQSADGKGDQITMNKAANLKGQPGGQGTGTAPPPPPPPPAEDKSREVQLAGATAWNCPFPPEADADQIDQAAVSVQVTVRPDGSALSVAVVSGGDHGFGRAARICALAKKYLPRLNRAGEPVVGSGLVRVTFSR